MSWEHAGEARAALNAIVSDPEHGVAALSSAQTMSNLLKDLLPDAPREKSILVAAAEAGLADTLRQHVDQGMDPDTAIRLTSSSFSATTPFTPEACNWVTGEIATALGMSHSQPTAQGGPGGAFGNPPGFGQAGQQGMPTQVAGSPGGYSAGQQPTQDYGQAAGGFGGAASQETRPGWQQPGRPGGQPQGGFGGQQGPGGQQAASGQPGGFGQNQPGGYGQPAGGGGFGGQPGAPGPGYAQPGAPGGWQGSGQPGAQPGYGQPGAQPGYGQPGGPGGWQPGGGGFGPVPGGPKGGGSRRGILIGGGLALLVVVAIVVGVSLSGGGKGKPSTPPPNSSPIVNPTTSTPTATPTPTHPPGTDSLATIMNPATGTPVGTGCITAKTFSINPATLVAHTFCPHTTRANVVVWGYQFDNAADYAKGLASINHYVGFDKVTPGTTCPPPSGTTEGKVGWHANHNPKYVSRAGQDIECLTDGGKPVLIWTMPTQDVFFIGQHNTKGTSINSLMKWWETLTYGS